MVTDGAGGNATGNIQVEFQPASTFAENDLLMLPVFLNIEDSSWAPAGWTITQGLAESDSGGANVYSYYTAYHFVTAGEAGGANLDYNLDFSGTNNKGYCGIGIAVRGAVSVVSYHGATVRDGDDSSGFAISGAGTGNTGGPTNHTGMATAPNEIISMYALYGYGDAGTTSVSTAWNGTATPLGVALADINWSVGDPYIFEDTAYEFTTAAQGEFAQNVDATIAGPTAAIGGNLVRSVLVVSTTPVPADALPTDVVHVPEPAARKVFVKELPYTINDRGPLL